MAHPSSAVTYANLVIGIDGGGSHTVALLAERNVGGKILGKGESGPSNIQAVGVERAMASLDECVAQAFQAAGIARGTVISAALGLAGIDHPEAEVVVREQCKQSRLADRISVDNDATLLLEAGTPDGWGLAVISGTGSIAIGRSKTGKMDRSGGWGHLLGDSGSGYGLALAGLRAVARSSDYVLPVTSLTDLILGFMGLNEPLDLIKAVYRGDWDRARLASLAPLVLHAANDGDEVAIHIVQTEAAELAKTAYAAARKCSLRLDGLPLAITGGTILNGTTYRNRFLSALGSLGVRPQPVTLVHEPADGAIRVARRIAMGGD